MGDSTTSDAAPFSVIVAGGGTGGHLYPGIAVARELVGRLPHARVSFVGTTRGLEARVIPREGWPLDFIRSAGLKGKSGLARLSGVLLLVPGFVDAWRVISRRRPSCVIGVGGYSSGPVVLAAALRGIDTMVLEQNARPGLTNRLLAHIVRAAAVSYEETLPFFHGRGFVAGNPVRAEFFAPQSVSGSGLDGQRVRRVLILGGSQGAHIVNVAMVAAAPQLVGRHPNVELVHQTGQRDRDDVRAGYAAAGIRARVEAFLDPVVGEVMAADLVVCRAGATTLAELAAAGRPAVLVPFAAATDDHQRVNAHVLERAGAALVVEEREATGTRLAALLGELVDDRRRLETMGQAMRAFARPDAARRIVDRVLRLTAVDDPTAEASR